jgi:hypothetical protein
MSCINLSKYHPLKKDVTIVRVKLRSMQAMILSLIFETLSMLLKTVIPDIQRWVKEDARCDRQTLKLLESISMCCIWLNSNVRMISLYKEWEQTIGLVSKQLNKVLFKMSINSSSKVLIEFFFNNKTLMNFMKSFATFINLICPIIDLDDGNTECLLSDVELMASRLFFDFYKTLDSASWAQVLRQPVDATRDILMKADVNDHELEVLCSRVGSFAKLLTMKEVRYKTKTLNKKCKS